MMRSTTLDGLVGSTSHHDTRYTSNTASYPNPTTTAATLPHLSSSVSEGERRGVVQEGASRLQKKTKKREMGKISIDKVCRRRTPPSVGKGGGGEPFVDESSDEKRCRCGGAFFEDGSRCRKWKEASSRNWWRGGRDDLDDDVVSVVWIDSSELTHTRSSSRVT